MDRNDVKTIYSRRKMSHCNQNSVLRAIFQHNPIQGFLPAKLGPKIAATIWLCS